MQTQKIDVQRLLLKGSEHQMSLCTDSYLKEPFWDSAKVKPCVILQTS